MRALYRAEVAGDPLEQVAEEVGSDESLPGPVREYAGFLLRLVIEHGEEIDGILRGALTRWDLSRVAVTDRSVLRMATAELLYEPSLPTRVILDEAIEIAKRYGSADSGRFVNGVLDRIAREHRGEAAESGEKEP